MRCNRGARTSILVFEFVRPTEHTCWNANAPTIQHYCWKPQMHWAARRRTAFDGLRERRPVRRRRANKNATALLPPFWRYMFTSATWITNKIPFPKPMKGCSVGPTRHQYQSANPILRFGIYQTTIKTALLTADRHGRDQISVDVFECQRSLEVDVL